MMNEVIAKYDRMAQQSGEAHARLIAPELINEIKRLEKRVAELEGDNHCLRVNLQALVTETPSGWTLTLEQAKADAMQALEDCKALSRKDGKHD